MRLIDADALKRMMLECSSSSRELWATGYAESFIDNAKEIDATPVVHGAWKSFPDCGVTRCSACDWSIEEAWWSKYCPDCGAKMDEVE